jgi:ribonucleoside-diphosphate reductase alpha chain
MGLSNLLYDTRTPYNSKSGYKEMEKLAESLSYYSMDESVQLARERGTFPVYEDTEYPEGEIPIAGYYERDKHQKDWDGLISKIKENGIRNGMTTTIAPTGSISMIADTSHGIEPEFSLAYEKNVTAGDFYYANEVFEEALKDEGIYSEELLQKINENYGSLIGLEEIPDHLKEVFVTALDIHYTDHLAAQASWQDWVTASISKTINMPRSATPDDVLNSFMLGHKLGLKGLTVYRDGSKSRQVLNMDGESATERNLEPSEYVKNYLEEEFANTPDGEKYWEAQSFRESLRSDKPKNKDLLEDETHPLNQVEDLEECPDCGGKVIHEGGCNKCVECGWSTCSIS